MQVGACHLNGKACGFCQLRCTKQECQANVTTAFDAVLTRSSLLSKSFRRNDSTQSLKQRSTTLLYIRKLHVVPCCWRTMSLPVSRALMASLTYL